MSIAAAIVAAVVCVIEYTPISPANDFKMTASIMGKAINSVSKAAR